MLDVLKDYVRLVDFQSDPKCIESYKARYGFVNEERAKFNFEGFSNDSLEFLFGSARRT